MARKKIVAGNWKMNKTPSEAVALVEELKPLVANEDVDVVFCVPAIDIIPVAEAVKGTNIQVGAENMYFEESGAYTGEISPAMANAVAASAAYRVLIPMNLCDTYVAGVSQKSSAIMDDAMEHIRQLLTEMGDTACL